MDITALTARHLKLIEHEDVQEAPHEAFLRTEGIKQGVLVPPLQRFNKPSNILAARIYRRQWIADCPYCPNAVIATRKVPYFYCPACGMAPDFQWWRVRFPSDKVIRDAQGPLFRRSRMNCYWYPDRETPSDLRQENIDHGLEPD